MRGPRGDASASPPYPVGHAGPCLVAGSAFSLHDDLARARAIYGPDVPVIAVNGAAREVRAFALYSQHPVRMSSHNWIRHQRRLFGGEFTVHGSSPDEKVRARCKWVDHWWQNCHGGGSSAWGARKLGWCMGFDLVVLCGCPLVPGNYAGHRPGMLMTHDNVINRYLADIEAEPEWHDGVVSMSGWTGSMFGGPQDV